jgi:hypothetical protein
VCRSCRHRFQGSKSQTSTFKSKLVVRKHEIYRSSRRHSPVLCSNRVQRRRVKRFGVATNSKPFYLTISDDRFTTERGGAVHKPDFPPQYVSLLRVNYRFSSSASSFKLFAQKAALPRKFPESSKLARIVRRSRSKSSAPLPLSKTILPSELITTV